MSNKVIKTFVLFSLFVIFLTPVESIIAPANDDWQVSTPEEQDISSDLLNTMYSNLKQKHSDKIHNLVITKNADIIFEKYYLTNGSHQWYSCTKTVMGILTGIAVDQGYIPSIDQKVMAYFPVNNTANFDERKGNITIKHLLMMRSGFEWGEWTKPYSDPSNVIYPWQESANWTKYAINRPMARIPGTAFDYDTGGSHILSAIIQSASGMATLDFAETYLFNPLGIEVDDWLKSNEGLVWGGVGLKISPRDMLKIGDLILNNGTRGGEQIVSEDWIRELAYTPKEVDYIPGTLEVFTSSFWTHYGYQTWISPSHFGTYVISARGFQGQFLTILPEYRISLVMNAELDREKARSVISAILSDYILPAVTASSQTLSISDEISTNTTTATLPLKIWIFIVPFSLVIIRHRKRNRN
ncbi:MAG: serine hydrolase domain-containing protein [Promethearchaeota archaeon]